MDDVTVYGATTPLGTRLIEKLLTSTTTVYTDSQAHAELCTTFAKTLSLGNSTLTISNGQENCRQIEFITSGTPRRDSDITVWPSASEYVLDERCHVVVHDLLLANNDEEWGAPEIQYWIDCISSKDEPSSDFPVRHWVSSRDVVSGLADLLRCESLPSGIVNMCGRKSWDPKNMIRELKILLRRTMNTANHAFDEDDMVIASSDDGASPSSKRPDLTKLHSALCQIHPDGWRTLTPIRVSLMEAIAYELDHSERGVQ